LRPISEVALNQISPVVTRKILVLSLISSFAGLPVKLMAAGGEER